LPEEERHKIKDLLFILEKINVSESAYREPTVFCDGLPRTYLVSSMTLIFSKINNKSLILCLSSSGKSWYENLLDDGLKSTLTLCPSVLSNFKYWGARP
jgi:hypothetical protein